MSNLALGALLRLYEVCGPRIHAPRRLRCKSCAAEAPFGGRMSHTPVCPIPQAEQALREAGLLAPVAPDPYAGPRPEFVNVATR